MGHCELVTARCDTSSNDCPFYPLLAKEAGILKRCVSFCAGGVKGCTMIGGSKREISNPGSNFNSDVGNQYSTLNSNQYGV